MKEKWTKGPWFMDFDLCDEECQLDDPEFNGRILDQDNMIVCESVIPANANLISAAPDLYDALELIYGRLLMSDRDGGSRITAEDGEMAELALKKARGEL